MVNDGYPLVNVYITNWKSTMFNGKIMENPPFSMGKLTISLWSFSIAMLVCQRVPTQMAIALEYHGNLHWNLHWEYH